MVMSHVRRCRCFPNVGRAGWALLTLLAISAGISVGPGCPLGPSLVMAQAPAGQRALVLESVEITGNQRTPDFVV